MNGRLMATVVLAAGLLAACSAPGTSSVSLSIVHVGSVVGSTFPVYISVKNALASPIIVTPRTVRLEWHHKSNGYYFDASSVMYMDGSVEAGSTPFQIGAGSTRTIVAYFPQLPTIPNAQSSFVIMVAPSRSFESQTFTLQSGDAVDEAAILAAQKRAAQRQQQEQTLSNEQQNIDGNAQSVNSDIQALASDWGTVQSDEQPFPGDLQTEKSDLQTTYQDYLTTYHLSQQYPNGDNGQIGTDAAQVSTDSAQVETDQAQIQTDDSQFSYDIGNYQQDLQSLQSDWSALQSSEAVLPTYQPAGLPSPAAVNGTIKSAQGNIASAQKFENYYLAQAQAMVNQADNYANKAESF